MLLATTLEKTPGAVPVRWMVPELLPQGELVLLDGAPGVGKSALLAHFATLMCRVEPRAGRIPVLYISSPLQKYLRILHLKNQLADLSHIHQVEFSREAFAKQQPGDTLKPLYRYFLEFVEQALQANKPELVLIDDLEELLDLSPPDTEQECRSFWMSLQLIAWQNNCTLIVPRVNGLHETRHYGPMARQAGRHAQFILTLHWHPLLADKRVVTVAKNLKGAMGTQWHLQFTEKGGIHLNKMELHQHVRPAKSPQTWQHDASQYHQDDEIVAAVTAHMNGQPVKKTELEEHIVELGFSQRGYRRAMAKLKLGSGRDGVDWYFIPPELVRSTLEEMLNTPVSKPRAAGAADGGAAELKMAG